MLDNPHSNSPIRLVVDNSLKHPRRIKGCRAHVGLTRPQVIGHHMRLLHRFHEAHSTYLFNMVPFGEAQRLGHKAAQDIRPNMSNGTVGCPCCWQRMMYDNGPRPGARLVCLSRGRPQMDHTGEWNVLLDFQPYAVEVVCPHCHAEGGDKLMEAISYCLNLGIDGVKIVGAWA